MSLFSLDNWKGKECREARNTERQLVRSCANLYANSISSISEPGL